MKELVSFITKDKDVLDLIRFGKFTGSDYVWAWKGGVFEGTGTDDYRDLYPIPGDEISANDNIKQNDGYN